MIRVFPRMTSATPTDSLAFVGSPGRNFPDGPVRISVTFSWDIPKALQLANEWRRWYDDVRIGGPAFDDSGDQFHPGKFLRYGYTITTRGCPRQCPWCFVPKREGKLRELEIKPGWDVLDNNLLAASSAHLDSVFAMLRHQKRSIRFTGGLDARLLDDNAILRLQTVPIERVYVAYDEPAQRRMSLGAIERLRNAGLTQRQVGCFVLIGYNGDTYDAAEARCREVYEAGGESFAMLYRDETNSPRNQQWRILQRTWCRPAASKAEIRKSIMGSRGPHGRVEGAGNRRDNATVD